MTRGDIRGRVRFFIDEPTAKNWSDSDLNNAINRAQEKVAQEITHIYEDYFIKIADLNPGGNPPGTIINQEFYTLPSDFLKFKRIERTDYGQAVPPIDINEKTINGTSVPPLVPLGGGGIAIAYFVLGNSVGFAPIPQSQIPIRLYYNYRLADLVNDTDVSDIPADWHDLMSYRAAIDAFVKDEADPSAMWQMWNEGIDRMHRTLRNRQTQEPRRVRRDETATAYLAPFTL